MATRHDLIREFGSALERHAPSLDLLLALATTYKVGADELAAKWEAYAVLLSDRRTGCGDDTVDLAVPTLDAHFDHLRTQLQKDQDAKYSRAYNLPDSASSVFVRKSSVVQPSLNKENLQAFIDSQILGTPLGKRAHARGAVRVTPRTNNASNNANLFNDPFDILPPVSSPASAKRTYPKTPSHQGKRSILANAESPSAAVTPSPMAQKYADRPNRGAIIEKYGEHVPYVPGVATSLVACDVSVVPGQQMEGYRYLNEKLADKGDALDLRIEDMTRIMKEVVKLRKIEESKTEGIPVKMNIEDDKINALMDDDFAPVGQPSQDPIVTCGRVCVDSSEGLVRLVDGNVVLEGSRETSAGDRVKLDLSAMGDAGFALFPGQVIAVEGTNPTGRVMNITRIYHPTPIPTVVTPPSDLQEFYPADDDSRIRPINIAIASGPYTLEDSLSFEPLEDLVVNFQKDSPDVIVLLGPFIDSDHPLIRGDEVDVALEELFAQQISSRAARILTHRPSTKIVMVPSVRDAVSRWICFPQPPLAAALRADEALRRRGLLGIPDQVLLLPNPVQLTINEIVIGISTMDVLTHLSAEEFARLPSGVRPDRVGRLCRHVLEQRNMYPLIPGMVDEACLDMSRYAALDLQATPDILIFSSALKHFAKNVCGCLCINPGHLAKGRGGGTFVRMCIHPLDIKEIL
ncbi:hypothetical protein SeMB42_g03811 [Synchytrium endobioticum]|uniref:DNA polymerase alpha subunit B n=1 Tax=Synchytrium endobioticum TaxID=286115 RepID=A0A507D3X9_9FUNG|nr:hypothetical protein SeMB42_g03811 [Synchytrium endobioticum]